MSYERHPSNWLSSLDLTDQNCLIPNIAVFIRHQNLGPRHLGNCVSTIRIPLTRISVRRRNELSVFLPFDPCGSQAQNHHGTDFLGRGGQHFFLTHILTRCPTKQNVPLVLVLFLNKYMHSYVGPSLQKMEIRIMHSVQSIEPLWIIPEWKCQTSDERAGHYSLFQSWSWSWLMS